MTSFRIARIVAAVIALSILATAHPVTAAAAEATGWLDPADYGAREDKSDADATTKAWIECIAAAIAQRKSITFKGDHLVNTDALIIRDQLVIRGNGVRVSRLFTTGAGALFTSDCALAESTGKGVSLDGFGVFCERTSTANGSIGIRLTNTGAANNAFSWLSHLVVSGFHDGIDVHNQYFYSITECYIDNYRRFGIRLSNDWTYDAGDGVVRENWIQPIQLTGGTGFDPRGSNIRVEQNPGVRIVSNKLFPGHAIGVHLYANGLHSRQAIPSGMYMIANNQFDSFGSGKDAIVIDSDYGRGGAGSTVDGNRLMNIQIVGNNLSNCGRLVDVRSIAGALQHLSILDNTAFGGGGIRITGDVDGLFVDGNHFDNRVRIGSGPTGFGPARPIEIIGALSNSTIGINSFVGFSSPADTVK